MLFGDNGLIGKAKQAVEKYKEAQEEEAARMKELDDSAYGEMYEGKDDSTPGEMAGDGTTKNPYLIQSIEDLVFLANQVNSGTETYKGQEIKLMVDLDFNSSDSYTNPTANKEELTTGAGFTPIGNLDNQFEGNFEGNNKTISNIYIDNDTLSYIGLFGYISDSKIQNLTITGSMHTKTSAGGGGISGASEGNSVISNIKNYTNIKSEVGTSAEGGIIGNNHGTMEITNCINKGNIENSNNTAGIIGYTDGVLKIENCYNEGNITNTKGRHAGGILGRDAEASNATTTIINSYNKGNVTSNKEEVIGAGDENNCIYIGGLVGRIYNELSIDGSHNEGKVQNLNQNYSKGYYLCVGGLVGIVNKDAVIKNSYNIGDVLDGTKVGGIIAYAGGNIIIDKCYNTGNLSTNEKLSFSETSTCIGGIVGFSKGVFVLNSYNSGNITNNSPQKSGSPASGIIGHVGSGTNSCIINTYNIGDISSLFSSTGIIYTVGTSKVYNVYNAGKILGTATYKYGLADIRNNGDVSGEYMYYLNNVELGATKEDLGIVMEENAMKNDSFVTQLNENIKKINLTEINPTLSEYKLVNWKKGSNGYPVFQ